MNKKALAMSILALIIIVGAAVWATRHPASSGAGQNGWQSYADQAYGFTVSYPSNWIVKDNLSATSTCCLFIAHWAYSTTTTMTASGTPQVAETAKELIKIQIGPYDRTKSDPFKAASTTPTTVQGRTAYTGSVKATDFTLIPRDGQTGIGAAIFPYLETPQTDKDVAKKIVDSIVLIATSTATSTKTK